MPYNGSNVFTQIYNWVTDKANSVLVTASRFEATYDDMATAFSNCVTRDGQGPMLANLAMGGFKVTGLAAGAAASDAVRVDQVASLAGTEVYFDAGNSGVALSIVWANGQHQQFTLTNNATITLGAGVNSGWYTLRILQDATGGRAITWAGAAYSASRWIGNATAPQMDRVASHVNIVRLFWDGTTWTQWYTGSLARQATYRFTASTTAQSITAATTATVAFALAGSDPYSEFSAGVFTAKVAGLYQLTTFVSFTTNTNTDGNVAIIGNVGGDSAIITRNIGANPGILAEVAIGLTAPMNRGDTAFVQMTNSMIAAIDLTAEAFVVISRIGDAQ